MDFFFILSGFVLTFAYIDKVHTPDFFKKFMISRIARLYPLYIASVLFLVVLNCIFYIQTGVGLEHGWAYQDGYLYTLIVNVLMLQSAGLTTMPSWNSPAWSLSAEFLVNIGLAFFLIWMGKKKDWFVAGILATLLAIMCYSMLFNHLKSLGNFLINLGGVLNSGLVRAIGGIFLGVVCYLMFYRLHQILITKKILVVMFTLLSGICITIIFVFGNRIPNVDFMSIPIMFCFIFCVACCETFTVQKKNFVNKMAEQLGNLSYGIYIIHYPLLDLLAYEFVYALKLPIKQGKLGVELIYLFVTCFLAHISFYKFELPMKKYLRSKLTKILIKGS